jgi:hypothetical protein
MRYAVIDTRIYEIEAVSQSEAIAQLEDQPDRTPIYHTTTAEPIRRGTPERPLLRVLEADMPGDSAHQPTNRGPRPGLTRGQAGASSAGTLVGLLIALGLTGIGHQLLVSDLAGLTPLLTGGR